MGKVLPRPLVRRHHYGTESHMRKLTSLLIAAALLAACRNPEPGKAAAPVPAAASKSATARLIDGMGNHHHPIATASPEAQQYFDQGFDLVFGFNHEEAA